VRGERKTVRNANKTKKYAYMKRHCGEKSEV
jgi:hypothetical protein